MNSKMTVLGDEALTAVSGGHKKHPRGKGYYMHKESGPATATGGSNQVFGDLDLRGKNTITIQVGGDFVQDASATADSSVS